MPRGGGMHGALCTRCTYMSICIHIRCQRAALCNVLSITRYMCRYTCWCVYVCMCICVYVYININISYVYIHIYIYTHTQIYRYIYLFVCICVYIPICVHAYIYINIYMHIYIMYIYIWSPHQSSGTPLKSSGKPLKFCFSFWLENSFTFLFASDVGFLIKKNKSPFRASYLIRSRV